MKSKLVIASERLLQGRRVGLLLLAFALFTGLGAAWAIAVPVGSAPDEPAHVIKAGGVARGEWFGEQRMDADGVPRDFFNVPEAFAELGDATCNRFQATTPVSDCPVDISQPPDALISAPSSAGDYNPAYYFLVGWPSLFSTGFVGIVLMRLASAVLVGALYAIAVWVFSFLPRPRLPLVVALAAFTPSVQAFAGAVNPQAAEVAALAAFTAALLTALRTRARGGLLIALAVVMVIGGGFGAQTRNLAWVWLGVIVLVALVSAGWKPFWQFLRRPIVVVSVALVLVAIVVNGLVLLSRDGLTAAVPHWGAGWSFPNAFVYMLRKGPEFLPSLFATFGWADVSDAWAIVAYTSLSVALVVGALIVNAPRRQRNAVLVAVLAMWVMPSLIQGFSMESGGFIWQGRYHLPLFVLVVFVAAVVLGDRLHSCGADALRRFTAAALPILAAVQLTSFGWMLYRAYLGIGSAPASLFVHQADGPFAHAPVLGTVGWIIVFAVLSLWWWAFAGLLVLAPTAISDGELEAETPDRTSPELVPGRDRRAR